MSGFLIHSIIFLAAMGILIGVLWTAFGAVVGLLVLVAVLLLISLPGLGKYAPK